MQARILMAGALFSGAMMVPAPHAASVTARYKVAQRIQQEVDATALGRRQAGLRRQDHELRAADAHRHHRRTQREGDGRLDPWRLPAARRTGRHAEPRPPAWWSPASWTRKGKVSNVKASSDAGGLQLSSLVQQLLPPIRAALKVGDAWTDTTETANAALGHHDHAHRHQLQGDRHRDARRDEGEQGRWRVQLLHCRHPGNAGRLGRHRGHRHRHVRATCRARRRLLGGTSSSTSNLNVTLAAQGATLPLVLSQSVEITPLP